MCSIGGFQKDCAGDHRSRAGRACRLDSSQELKHAFYVCHAQMRTEIGSNFFLAKSTASPMSDMSKGRRRVRRQRHNLTLHHTNGLEPWSERVLLSAPNRIVRCFLQFCSWMLLADIIRQHGAQFFEIWFSVFWQFFFVSLWVILFLNCCRFVALGDSPPGTDHVSKSPPQRQQEHSGAILISSSFLKSRFELRA